MLATVWLLWCVVCASCEPGHGSWEDRHARCGSSSMETSMCLRIRGHHRREYEISEYSEYEFEEGEDITLRCSTAATPSRDWMLLWTDEPGGPRYSEAPSSTELRLQLTAGVGDHGALLRCNADPIGGYDLRHHHHIELMLKAKSGVDRSSHPIYLRQGEPWKMRDCDSGWIKQRQRKNREAEVYKRGDTIFQHFNKKANGTILYCNLYHCRSNPSSQEFALSMKEVLECTRTQLQYIFLLNEDSRGDTNNKPVAFPDNRKDVSENKQQNTHTPYRTKSVSTSYSGSAGSNGNKWNMLDDVPGAEHPIIAGASVGSPGVDPEPKQTEETKQGTNVAVVVGSLLGVVVLAVLVALVLLLRHLAAHRNQAPSEPYVVYTELAEGRGGAPPPPPRNLTPYAVVVGTLVPASKHAQRPISHTYCTVK